ncbi:23S rRNA (uracil(1939)-C(5))-methyltransferase RlmD [Chloroflexota bacterium]
MPETIDLELTAMAHGGSALGRARIPGAGSGRAHVMFVPYTIPGETVRVDVTQVQARWANAQLLKVLEPSPHRVVPPCPHFGPGKCGGCHFQHISYEAQAEFKREVVLDQLRRIGGLEDANVQGIIGAAEPWGYRNHAQLSVTPGGELGFLTGDTHNVVPVKECLILDPLLDDLWAALDMEWPQLHRLHLRCGSATGDLLAVFELDHYEDFDIQVDFPVSCVLLLADGEVVVLMGNPFYREHVAGRDFRVSAGSFFQVNSGGAEALVSLVDDYLALSGDERLVDLYCGVGLFSLSLAGSVVHMIAVESDSSAVADFRHNARDLENVTLIEGTAGRILPRIEGPVDGLILDPPRSGAGDQVVDEIVRLAPSRVVYVSCDPATLARDARRLTGTGYRLDQVQPVDLFPQTYHVESVALFIRDA